MRHGVLETLGEPLQHVGANVIGGFDDSGVSGGRVSLWGCIRSSMTDRVQEIVHGISPKLHRLVLWLEQGGVAMPLRWTLRVAVGLLPVAAEFDLVSLTLWQSGLVVLLWLAAFVFLLLLEHYHEGSIAARHGREMARVQGPFAGNLENLDTKLGRQRGLTEAECRNLCVSFLARIKDLMHVLYRVEHENRLRVTLAVPQRADNRDGEAYLRVWCYDRPYTDRHWSILSMDLPGAPQAYRTNRIAVVPDITQEKLATEFHMRRFKSILSIPVGGKRDKSPCGVVNIDATEPNFFDVTYVASEVITLVQPIVQSIGITLHSRQTEENYEFDQ